MIAFCAAPSSVGLGEGDVQRLEQRLALGVVRDRGGEVARTLRGRRSPRSRAARSASDSGCGRLVVGPLLGGLVQRLVVLVELVFQRLRRRLLAELALAGGRTSVSSAPAMANVDDASSLRSTSVMSERWLAGQRLQVVALQVLGHEVVEPVFALFRRELLDERQALACRGCRRVTCRRSVRWQIGFEPRLQRRRTPAPGRGWRTARGSSCRSPKTCSSMKLTRPNSSSSEFCSGVAVSSSLGAVCQRHASACWR